MSRYSRQRNDENNHTTPETDTGTDTGTTDTTTHKHFSISIAGTGPLLSSGTRSEQVHRDNLFLHGASNQGPRTLAQGKSDRELTEQVTIVIVIWKRKKELTGKKKKEKKRKKERERET